jgi:hypothetical protein
MDPTVPIGWTRGGKPIYPIAGGSDPSSAGQPNPNPAGDPGQDQTGQGQGQGQGQPGQGQGQGQGGASQSGQPPPGGSPTPASSDKGFPEGVPLEQMTAEQREAYWKHYARQHEQRNKDLLQLAGGSYDDLKAKLEGYDQLRQQQQTEQERAVETAKAEGRNEGRRQAASQMVDEHVRAAVSAGRLSQQQADVLLEGLDRTAYVDQNASVDADKVKTLIDTFAPQQQQGDGNSDGSGRGNGHPDLGQGRRQGSPTEGGIEAGREKARQRHPQQQTSQS